MLEVALRARRGDFVLDAAFEAPARGILALFGRSGSGKTTIATMLAGLLRPETGRIALDGAVLFDSAGRVDLAPERRRIGYVFQEGRLFPHLTARGNLLYGWRRTEKARRRLNPERVFALLGLDGLLGRRPGTLSGGEQQRVAIGRALLSNPSLLILDEPLSSLDPARRAEILPFIERLRDDLALPIVYVSHDMGELLRLADRAVLMAEGRVAAVGTVEDILGRLDLAALTGMHEVAVVLEARVVGQDEAFHLTRLSFAGGELRVPRLELPAGTSVRVRVNARDVSIALTAPSAVSILNIVSGTVVEIAPADGAQVHVRLDVGTPLWARITARSVHDLELRPGGPVYAMIKAVAIDARDVVRARPA